MSENDSTLNKQEGAPPPSTKMPKGDTASSSQPARDKIFAKRQWCASLIGSSLVILTVVAAVFYICNGEPLIQFLTNFQASLSQQLDSCKQAARQFPASASVILGEYKDEVYLFKGEQNKIYAYKPTNKPEREICEFAGIDGSFWHPSGRVVLLSSVYNFKGGLYLLDLNRKTPPPKPELITNREADPYFPPDLTLESSLPLVWGTSGNIFAFVARNKDKSTQFLFIYDLPHKKLIAIPTQNFRRIADLVWINGDNELVFTAINDGRENRYRVNSSGGDFRTWDAQP